MSSSITKEQRNNIRKSLPLKIFDRRGEAQAILNNIEFLKETIFKINRINPELGTKGVEFHGEDILGNPVEVSCNLIPSSFNRVKEEFLKTIGETKQRREKQYAEIPTAKIIPFDFRKKEVEADRRPYPNPPPKKEEPQTILKGGTEICKAAGIYYSEVKPFVKEKGLPAFKIPGRKFWFAFPKEIEAWKIEQGRPTNA